MQPCSHDHHIINNCHGNYGTITRYTRFAESRKLEEPRKRVPRKNKRMSRKFSYFDLGYPILRVKITTSRCHNLTHKVGNFKNAVILVPERMKGFLNSDTLHLNMYSNSIGNTHSKFETC